MPLLRVVINPSVDSIEEFNPNVGRIFSAKSPREMPFGARVTF